MKYKLCDLMKEFPELRFFELVLKTQLQVENIYTSEIIVDKTEIINSYCKKFVHNVTSNLYCRFFYIQEKLSEDEVVYINRLHNVLNTENYISDEGIGFLFKDIRGIEDDEIRNLYN